MSFVTDLFIIVIVFLLTYNFIMAHSPGVLNMPISMIISNFQYHFTNFIKSINNPDYTR